MRDFQDSEILFHVCKGVFYGYPQEDIVHFTQRQFRPKLPFVEGTPFEGTGYMCYKPKQSNEDYVREINAKRFCQKPFSGKVDRITYEELVIENQQHCNQINDLLKENKQFRTKVLNILLER